MSRSSRKTHHESSQVSNQLKTMTPPATVARRPGARGGRRLCANQSLQISHVFLMFTPVEKIDITRSNEPCRPRQKTKGQLPLLLVIVVGYLNVFIASSRQRPVKLQKNQTLVFVRAFTINKPGSAQREPPNSPNISLKQCSSSTSKHALSSKLRTMHSFKISKVP